MRFLELLKEKSPYSSFTFPDLFPIPPTPTLPILHSFKPVPFEKFIRIDREPLFEEDSQKLNGRGKNGQQMGRMHSASIYHQVRVFGGRIKGATLHLHPKCPSYSVAALMDLLNGTVF